MNKKILYYISFLFVILVAAWILWKLMLLEIYLLFCLVSVFIAWADLPWETFLGKNNLMSFKNSYGEKRLVTGKYASICVRDLCNQKNVVDYFYGYVRDDDTHKLCVEFKGKFLERAVVSIGATIFFIFFLPHIKFTQSLALPDKEKLFLSAWGVFSTYFLVLIWQIVEICYQRRQNLKLQVN